MNRKTGMVLYFLVIFCMLIMLCEENNIEPYNMQIGEDVSIQVNKKYNEPKDGNELMFFNKPSVRPLHTNIKIYKQRRILELYGDEILIGRFRIALGGSPEGDKEREGDSKTPEGKYYICTRNPKSIFTLFMGLSYPNTEDAERGLNNNIINEDMYERIKAAEELKQCPPWDTPMGGEVGIHGGGNSHDWTRGCIAMSDEDIWIIWEYTELNTVVEIFK